MGERRYEGGDLLVEALQARGVERIFSVSGGPINSVYAGAHHHGLPLCHVRHEAAAGFMADATARVTGTPGVAVVTLGPGVTNTVTPAATAQLAGVPMLIVGGQAPTRLADRGAGMSLSTLPIMRPVTAWAAEVRDTERIPEYVDAAWRHMLGPRPGPVYLEIPVDVLSAAAVPARTPPEPRRFSAAPDDAAVAAVGEALSAARRPLIIAGDDVRWSGAGAALRTFVERHEIPVTQCRLARGAVPEDHPLSAGPAYLPANPVLEIAFAEADLILLLGYYFDFDLGFGDTVPDQVTVVQVYPDPRLLGRNRVPDLAVAASTAALLDALAPVAKADPDEDWCRGVAQRWRDHHAGLSAQAGGARPALHPVALVEAVQASMPAETTYVTSHGNIDFWADAQLRITDPTRYLRAGQAGALGAEIPYGVAAQLARPGDPVVAFVGDGGVGYHGLELETAARYGAPVIVVVADDARWGAIAIPQRAAYGVEVEMDLPRRDWAGLVRTIGGHGETVSELGEVPAAMARARRSGLPAVVHAPVASVLSPYMAAISE